MWEPKAKSRPYLQVHLPCVRDMWSEVGLVALHPTAHVLDEVQAGRAPIGNIWYLGTAQWSLSDHRTML